MITTSHNDIAHAIYLATEGKSREELSVLFKKIIKFLDRRRLLFRAPEILASLDKIINLKEGRVVVKVSSARELSPKAKKDLSSFLEKHYKAKEVVLIEKLNEKLLGGVRLEINDEIIDLTVKNKIKKLQEHLIKKYE